MDPDHSAARARRHDDIVERFEFGQRLFGEIARDRALARVVRGLAAARLRGRHDDVAARLLQQLERGEADLGPHQVDDARDEQSDSHRRSFEKTSLIIRRSRGRTNAGAQRNAARGIERGLPRTPFAFFTIRDTIVALVLDAAINFPR
ncbi:hypothetical protein DO70_5300 [Burkholderia pseudomallei]|nr:hypothetical protein DO70_5300 [Burkholderia pseudomallei]